MTKPKRTLHGGGSRERKKLRRLPTTVEGLRRSWDTASQKKKGAEWRRGYDIEDSSTMVGDRIVKFKAKILPDTIVPGLRCVYFVTESPAQYVGYKRFEATKLCKGGTALTGFQQYEDRDLAARVARDRAMWERNQRAALAVHKEPHGSKKH